MNDQIILSGTVAVDGVGAAFAYSQRTGPPRLSGWIKIAAALCPR
jgi:hypothetical protein